MKNSLLLLLFIGLCSILFSQQIEERKVTVQGTIYSVDNLPSPLSNVHVFVSNKLGVTSNAQGFFSITLMAEDTLYFKHIGYEPLSFIVTDSIVEINADFFLKKDTLTLNTFSVKRFKDFEAFKTAVLKMRVKDENLTNAQNNMALILHHYKSGAYVSMDAEENQKAALKQHINVSTKYMINLEGVAQLIVNSVKKRKK